MKISGIYKISCVANGKYYYGSAVWIDRRCGAHRTFLRYNKHINPIMQSVWNKHGERSFLFELECECSLEDLLPLEQAYLDEYWGKPGCMNIAKFATGGMAGLKWTESQKLKLCNRRLSVSTKKKISKSMMGKSRLWLLGRITPESTRKKLSDALLGRKASVKSIENMKKAQRGSGNNGTHLTENNVRMIRKLYASGLHTQKSIGQKFNVGEGAIGAILCRKNWSHVK